ncbi:hypothetical protein AXF42_Ash018975 [Apostasia shenzhenica]|uniref:Aldehyde oxidase GLOX n=1 Tax=Apostasia shenzhenica TaxID=1088818 RepID=A0A2I0ABZ5_9ASPA|nr:hypothetical protein AXF42_Ash018975 [Apostasia shenzhenica]
MKPTYASTLLLVLFFLHHAAVVSGSGGRWSLLQQSVGVSAMHMQLLRNDRVIIFDRTDFGPSNLSLPDGKCRDDPNDQALPHDCTAHSVEYDVASNSYRPLTVLTDTWCSSGTVAPDGLLIQTGGFNDGDRAVRVFQPCSDRTCDWAENPTALAVRRWYATNQILPDGRAIIVGGRRQFNYEFYPKNSAGLIFTLPFLLQTKDPEENNLYPFIHLNVDGNLFVFSNNRAILLDYKSNKIVKTFPAIPGGDPRNYPSSGSSVLLPLWAPAVAAEVLVCGGSPKGAYNLASVNGTFVKALSTCGRIRITDASPAWEMEMMPAARVMGDMVLLPTGADVLIINGAGAGTAGWELGRQPALAPVLYRPGEPAGPARFALQNPSSVPRLYHSTAVLLRDGRVLVGGSNPHVGYKFVGVQFPTDLRLEAFSPDYLLPSYSAHRPQIVSQDSPALELRYGEDFTVRFTAASLGSKQVRVTMVAPAFTTHSFSMNQRLLILESEAATSAGGSSYDVTSTAPSTATAAPPGYYMLFVVNAGIPSEGAWVHIH